MKTHLVTLKDGSEYRLNEDQATRTSLAIDNQKNFYLEDDYVSWMQVVSIKRIVSSAEKPVLRLDAPELTEKQLTRIGEEKQKIRAMLEEKVSPYEKQKREYLAAVAVYKDNGKVVPEAE